MPTTLGWAASASSGAASVKQFLFRLMRMHADAAPDIGELFRHCAHAGKARQFGADADTDADTGGAGPRHHAFDIAGIVGKIQMAMTIHQHQRGITRPPRAVRRQVARRGQQGLARLQMQAVGAGETRLSGAPAPRSSDPVRGAP